MDITYNYSCEEDENYGGKYDFTVPDIPAGVYYAGIILDTANVISELNESNNATLPENTAEFIIKDKTRPSEGAFKFVNSWGDWSTTWENIADGHYWVTYRTMKKQEMMVRYYYNNFSSEYEPTVVALFRLTNNDRNNCKVTLGLGDPDNPYMVKELQSRFGSTLLSGDHPFPSNNIVLDISDFASSINDYDLFLKIENTSSSICTVNNFSVEFYSDYDSPAFKTITGAGGSAAASGSASFISSTKDSLSLNEVEEIIPQSRSSYNLSIFNEEKPGSTELAQDMTSGGIYQPGVNYNATVYGGFKTGDIPLTADEWKTMKKLRSVNSIMNKGAYPVSVDHSKQSIFHL